MLRGTLISSLPPGSNSASPSMRSGCILSPGSVSALLPGVGSPPPAPAGPCSGKATPGRHGLCRGSLQLKRKWKVGVEGARQSHRNPYGQPPLQNGGEGRGLLQLFTKAASIWHPGAEPGWFSHLRQAACRENDPSLGTWRSFSCRDSHASLHCQPVRVLLTASVCCPGAEEPLAGWEGLCCQASLSDTFTAACAAAAWPDSRLQGHSRHSCQRGGACKVPAELQLRIVSSVRDGNRDLGVSWTLQD